jgi:hypothetical protein
MRDRTRNLRRHAVGRACSLAEGSLAALGVPRPQALLLLGHMRCGSTLLLHLLMTNPQVSAQGERNAVYAGSADLARLALSTRLAHPAPLRRLRYVADQVNHNHATPDAALLMRRRVRTIFLLRASDAALASLLELSRVFYEGAWSPARALEYYLARVARLQELAGALAPGQAAFLTYETLTAQPAAALESLRVFLWLDQGFSQEYRVHGFTGERGDPGPRIGSGRVQPAARAPVVTGADPHQLQRARAAHRTCSAALARFALLPADRVSDG